eukprot:g15942.t1
MDNYLFRKSRPATDEVLRYNHYGADYFADDTDDAVQHPGNADFGKVAQWAAKQAQANYHTVLAAVGSTVTAGVVADAIRRAQALDRTRQITVVGFDSDCAVVLSLGGEMLRLEQLMSSCPLAAAATPFIRDGATSKTVFRDGVDEGLFLSGLLLATFVTFIFFSLPRNELQRSSGAGLGRLVAPNLPNMLEIKLQQALKEEEQHRKYHKKFMKDRGAAEQEQDEHQEELARTKRAERRARKMAPGEDIRPDEDPFVYTYHQLMLDTLAEHCEEIRADVLKDKIQIRGVSAGGAASGLGGGAGDADDSAEDTESSSSEDDGHHL